MNDRPHVLIVNQHGENRGDESAMRAMIDGLETGLGPARYTIVVQFRDTNLAVPFRESVTLLHLRMPLMEMAGLFAYGALRRLGLSLRLLLTARTRPIVAAYESADLVLSAPGGPYFGDIYADHEIVHWFYVWLATVYRKPLFLYAPSAGPFRIRWLNLVRRHLFRRFDVLCVREAISAGFLEALLGKETRIEVTADAAIQQRIAPCRRDEYFRDGRSSLTARTLVAVSAIEYKFPGEADPAAKQRRYDDALAQCLRHLADTRSCHFLFVPQLYGGAHDDAPYLRRLAERLPANASWELVDQTLDSDGQRAIFGMADLCIASRYHPQIFAASAGVPGICIYYEHKALGFMSLLGLEDFAFDIRDPDATSMCRKLDEVLERRDTLARQIDERMPAIRARSRRTTELAVALFRATSAAGTRP